MPDLQEDPTRESWDNWSEAVQPEDSPAHSSASKCSSGCVANPGCLQYSYSEGTCKFGFFVQTGRAAPDTDYTSGWNLEKIYRLGYEKDEKKSSSCTKPTWLKPVI